MTIQRYIKAIGASLFMATIVSTSPASAWDFDRTRAADIVDRAANDGNATAQLLLAMAVDERISTIYDDLPFRLPSQGTSRDLHIQNLDADDIYDEIIWYREAANTKESLMSHVLQAHYYFHEGNNGMATVYYLTASSIGEKLIRKHAISRDLAALTQDAKAGVIAAQRCDNHVPKEDSTRKIANRLSGLRHSEIAKDYRSFIMLQSKNLPSSFSLDHSGCWSYPLRSATIVRPLTPFDYETNTSKMIGVKY